MKSSIGWLIKYFIMKEPKRGIDEELKVQVLFETPLRTEILKRLRQMDLLLVITVATIPVIKLANKNNPQIFPLVDSVFDQTQFIKFVQRLCS